jgi:D-methionine transport system substrate-binding protein
MIRERAEPLDLDAILGQQLLKLAAPQHDRPPERNMAHVLFEKAGLIKLREAVREKANVHDIVDNPKRLKFLEIEAPQLPRVLDDVELAQVSISYLIASGGHPESLLIADGFGDPRHALQFVARTDKKDDPRLLRFVSIYRSQEVKDYINEKYGRFFVPVW